MPATLAAQVPPFCREPRPVPRAAMKRHCFADIACGAISRPVRADIAAFSACAERERLQPSTLSVPAHEKHIARHAFSLSVLLRFSFHAFIASFATSDARKCPTARSSDAAARGEACCAPPRSEATAVFGIRRATPAARQPLAAHCLTPLRFADRGALPVLLPAAPCT